MGTNPFAAREGWRDGDAAFRQNSLTTLLVINAREEHVLYFSKMKMVIFSRPPNVNARVRVCACVSV